MKSQDIPGYLKEWIKKYLKDGTLEEIKPKIVEVDFLESIKNDFERIADFIEDVIAKISNS